MISKITAILHYIRYIGAFSHLLPLVFFLLFKKKTKEKSLRVIFYYIMYCIVHESLGFYLHQIHKDNLVNFLFAFFTVAEFSFFCLFFYYVLPKANPKKFIFPIWLCFIIFSLIDFFFMNKMEGFDSFTSGIQTLFIIGLCIYYLVIQIKGKTDLYIYSTSNFWIIITFLISLSGTFFLYILLETMIHDQVFINTYTIINSIFNLLKNVLLSMAMMMKSDQTKPELKKNYDWIDYNHVN